MAEVTYVTIPQMTAATDSQVTDNGLLEMAVVDANAASGYSPKKVTRGQLLKDLKEEISELDGISDDLKAALLQIASKVAYIDDDGQDYYDALYDALYPAATLESISAVYTQSGTVYDTDSLDSLKNDLVVTALWSDTTTTTVPAANYTLLGSLTEGTSTITVSYNGKTTTFTVTVTHLPLGLLYRFNQSLESSGSESITLTGTEVYDTGINDAYCYKHFTPTSGTASSDTQYGLKATGLTDVPDFGGDFTISFWMATQINKYCHPYTQCIYVNNTNLGNYFTGVEVNATGWSATVTETNSNNYAGFVIQGSTSGNGKLIFRFANGDLTAGAQLQITFPNNIDTTQWHHYALTKKNGNVRFFFDGTLIATAATLQTTVYNSGQLAISTNFFATSASKSDIQQMPNGEKLQDLYIAEFCKWETDFDTSSITY